MGEKVIKYLSRIVANWDRVPLVEGRILEKGKAKIKDRDRGFIFVATDEGEVQVFESAGLEELFDAATVGDFCRIQYLATVATSNNRTFRQFRASLWSDPEAPPLKARKPTVFRERKAKV
jgi:hypothetical protein